MTQTYDIIEAQRARIAELEACCKQRAADIVTATERIADLERILADLRFEEKQSADRERKLEAEVRKLGLRCDLLADEKDELRDGLDGILDECLYRRWNDNAKCLQEICRRLEYLAECGEDKSPNVRSDDVVCEKCKGMVYCDCEEGGAE